jgi:uncharacterized protein (DUF433 family)
MKALAELDRITFDPKIMVDRACIRGMQIPVSVVINLIVNGLSTAEIIEDYPYLEPANIQQALKLVSFETRKSWVQIPPFRFIDM